MTLIQALELSSNCLKGEEKCRSEPSLIDLLVTIMAEFAVHFYGLIGISTCMYLTHS